MIVWKLQYIRHIICWLSCFHVVKLFDKLAQELLHLSIVFSHYMLYSLHTFPAMTINRTHISCLTQKYISIMSCKNINMITDKLKEYVRSFALVFTIQRSDHSRRFTIISVSQVWHLLLYLFTSLRHRTLGRHIYAQCTQENSKWSQDTGWRTRTWIFTSLACFTWTNSAQHICPQPP